VTLLTFYSDPSHGYLEATRDQLVELGVDPAEITSYSYQRDNSKGGLTYYLEEDCDAALYIDALDSRGIPYDVDEIYSDDSFVRRLSHVTH